MAGEGKTAIRFWNGFTGPDGRTMLRLVRRFNEENPDAQVMMQRMDWSTYYNKLFVAGMGGRAPEVFVVHAGSIERFMQARFVRTVDDLMAGASGLDAADFSETVWAATEKDGVHYGVPLDVHILGLYYNKTLFREAGIVDGQGNPRPPTNRDEFLDAARKLTIRDADGKTERWAYVFTWFRTNVFTFMSQWGGEFFTPDHTRCTLNAPENVEALQFCVDLVRKERVAPPPENFDSWIGFQQGRVAMVFEGIYMLADLEKMDDLDIGAAPLPQLGSQPAAWADSHCLCLRDDLSEAELDAAWRFIRFLSDNSLDWARGGQVPVRKSLRDTPEFEAMEFQREFARQLDYIRYVPRVPFIFEFYTEFDAAIEKALRGSATPQEALDEATENVNKIIKRYEED